MAEVDDRRAPVIGEDAIEQRHLPLRIADRQQRFADARMTRGDDVELRLLRHAGERPVRLQRQ
jgi:hypothetical protein